MDFRTVLGVEIGHFIFTVWTKTTLVVLFPNAVPLWGTPPTQTGIHKSSPVVAKATYQLNCEALPGSLRFPRPHFSLLHNERSALGDF